MKSRVLNKNSKDYVHYGGRGIKLHHHWHEFTNFFADMGTRPKDTTLDRIDVDGDYEPLNCRWATRREQVMNRRFTINAKGYYYNKARLKYVAITRKYYGQREVLGIYDTEDEAKIARKNWELLT